MNIFCASGGGTKGAFHGGVYQALLESGIAMDALVGVSTGALISGWMSQSTPQDIYSQTQFILEYRKVWESLTSTKDIRKGNLWSGIKRILTGEPSVYTLDPLRTKAEQIIKPDAAFPMPVRLGIVDLQSTSFVQFNPKNRSTLIDGMIASSTIPMIAPPVTIIDNGKVIIGVDGGVRTVSPIEMPIALGKELSATVPIRIFVSNATPVAGFVPGDLYDRVTIKYWPVWKVITRSLWIQGHEIIRNDINLANEINKLIQFCEDHEYELPEFLKDKRKVEIVLINSMRDPYDTWEVNSSKISQYWEYGRSECQRIIHLSGLDNQ